MLISTRMGDTFELAGRAFMDVMNLLHFPSRVGGAANGLSSLRLQSGNAGFQVPAGKTLYLMGMWADVITNGGGIQVGYSNTPTDYGIVAAGPPNVADPRMPSGLTLGTIAESSIATPYSKSGAFALQIPAGAIPWVYNGGNADNVFLSFYGYLR